MMHDIEDEKLRIPRGIQDLQHMRNTVIRFCNDPNTFPQLASLRDEVVVRIDHQKSSNFFVVCQHLSALNSLSANGRDWHQLNIDVRAKNGFGYQGIR